jgi:hypothetical protein
LPVGHARLVERWPYDRLYKESDYVVIVSFESTKDAKKLFNIPEDTERLPLVTSKLTIQQSLKGDLKNGDTLEIEHWRQADGLRLPQHLPSPIVWEKTKSFLGGDTRYLREVNYLVFLKKSKSGKPELTTGILNGLDSVKELLAPSNPKTPN